MYDSYLTWSGGSFNHYMAKIMSKIISSGALKEHTQLLRIAYKKRLEALCLTIDELKPDGWIYQKPKGGFFVWVMFPEIFNALEFLKFAREKFDVTYLPGICCSPTLTSQNCARLSFSCLSEEIIVQGVQRLISAYKNFASM
ncbi:hypothetical protein Btru_025670 [Bulinus truncatus]|nr:hypothetical protein Btru_025670 [Bulinus truncatus]